MLKVVAIYAVVFVVVRAALQLVTGFSLDWLVGLGVVVMTWTSEALGPANVRKKPEANDQVVDAMCRYSSRLPPRPDH